MAAIITLLCSPQGRIGRRTFWVAILGIVAVNLLAGALPGAGALISLLALWPLTCLLVKRLHDMGRSGALAVLPVTAMVALTVLSLLSALSAMSALAPLAVAFAAVTALAGLLGALAVLGFILWVGLAPSQQGPNAYGSSADAAISF